MKNGIGAVMPKFNMPYTIAETIAYDPTARDLSVEIAKAKATGAEALLMVSRLNDAILLTREMVKQRWSPMAVLSMGPGWYEDQYLKTLGKLSDGPLSFVPWYDPNKKLAKAMVAALAKSFPGVSPNTNHVYTFEALLVAADAYKRAKSTDPKALADAIRTTNITDNVSTGPGHPVRRQGPERQAEELGDSESRRQARHGRAEGRDRCDAAVADDAVRQALNVRSVSIRAPACARGRSLCVTGSGGARRNLSQRRRQRPVDRPRLRPDGARPLGDLRDRARGQFRPRRDDDDRDVCGDRAVRRLQARSAGDAGADRRAAVRARLSDAGGADQSVHQPAGAQPVHAADRGRDHPGERAADRVRAGCPQRPDLVCLSTASRSAR